MGVFDYFVGNLECSRCRKQCADTSSNIQTKIAYSPAMEELRVGTYVEINTAGLGYFRVSEGNLAESVEILDTWECPNCNLPFNWASVVVRDNRIQSIESVELSESVLASVDFLSIDIDYLFGAYDKSNSFVAYIDRIVDSINKEREQR